MSRQVLRALGAADSAAGLAAETRAEDHSAQERIRELEEALAHGAESIRDARDQAARWERLFDAISDPIGVVSADSRLVYANAAYRALFDRVPDGVIGHECFSAHPNPSGGPCDTCPVPAAIRSRKPAFVQSERPPRRGEASTSADDVSTARHIFQRWTYPVITAEGHIDEVVEIIKDVTEQERLRTAARQAEALRTADRLKAELLGTVSHELRSPLAAIKGYAGTLLRHDGRLPRAERHAFLTAIAQSSDRLEAIIDQLLLMSQLETGLITLHQAPLDLRQLAHEAVTGLARRLPREAEDTNASADSGTRQHRVIVIDHASLRPRANTPSTSGAWWAPVVIGDRRLLRQALDEVLDNAVKYSPDGGLIEVTLDRLPPAPEEPGTTPLLVLRVRDEGLGIPTEQLGHIFERFHRVEGGLTSAYPGLGLGLTICKRVIELHGGRVRVESEPGKGTTLCLLLPEASAAGDPGDLAEREGGDTPA
ncbi:MAG TPA: ATP-binding protein [Ktedonobacterales bacterium]